MTTAFLQREPEAADRERWRAELAEAAPRTRHEGRVVLFVFRVGGERFGIEPTHLELTAPMPKLHGVPHRGPALAGMVNVRGAVTLCFSLPVILGSAPGAAATQPMMLVLTCGTWRVACQVDAAEGVAELEHASLQPVPATLHVAGRAKVKGIFPSNAGPDIAWLEAASLFEAFEGAAR
jgi:chemotaxis signal transduction protein